MITGTNGNDVLDGTSGNDWINPFDSPNGISDGDVVRGSIGLDDIIYYNNLNGYQEIQYHLLDAGIFAVVNGPTDTAYVDKAGPDNFDGIWGINNPLHASGFGIFGSNFGDAFNLNGGTDTWMQVFGGDGSDVFNISLTGTVRIVFEAMRDGIAAATQGININLANQTISNDGFGNTDTLNMNGSGGLEIRATNQSDTIVGSDRNENFFLLLGTDSLDGGGGTDTVMYHRFGVEAVNVNLATGSATGTIGGTAFSHTLSGIENVRGSDGFGDILTGNSSSNKLQGYGGNDRISGASGDDYLDGGNGQDRISGGSGNDYLDGGKGRDYLNGGADNDTLFGGDAADKFVFTGTHSGNDTILDFTDNVDTLLIDNALWVGSLSVQQVLNNFATVINDADTFFDFGGGNTITVIGVSDTSILLDDITII